MPATTTGLMPALPVSRSARHREPVAAAAHGLDQRVLPERLERLPQPPDVDVDRALLDVRVDRPTRGPAAASANARAPGARAGSAAAGIRWGRAEPSSPSAVTRCVVGSSLSAPAGKRFLRRLGRVAAAAPP